VVFLSGAGGRRYIMRIARSPIALARAARNFEAIEQLHGSSLPQELRNRVPAPVARGCNGGYSYFVEACLDGRAGPVPARTRNVSTGWLDEAVSYLSALHMGTARRIVMDEFEMTRLVRAPLARIARACTAADALQVLRRVQATCELTLADRVLPLVRTHGDFTESNCLFGSDARLTAVVDWEVSMAEGLPLLDLLQLLPVPGELGSHPRWQRFDRWLDLWREPEHAVSDGLMEGYVRALDLPTAVIPGLILAQWVTHVADRIEARRDDERWVRLRLWQPLESLGRLLCD
jgi:aminoglycoside phosphotransferase (APT) family kinase protein